MLKPKMPKCEYLLHWWGECEESIKEKYGYNTYLWFDTLQERDIVKKKIIDYCSVNNLGYGYGEHDGYLTRRKTVACMVWKYKDERGYLEYDYGYGYSADDALFMFEEGNYACDCNRSNFIQCFWDKDFPELECGDEIELLQLWIEFRG